MTPDIEKAIRESLLMAVRGRLAPYGTFKAKKTTGSPACDPRDLDPPCLLPVRLRRTERRVAPDMLKRWICQAMH